VVTKPGEMCSQVFYRDGQLVGVIITDDIMADIVIGNGKEILLCVRGKREKRQHE
jgi:hypothetical protein